MVERKKGKKLQVKVSIDTVHVGENSLMHMVSLSTHMYNHEIRKDGLISAR
ncbi:hypothetical protein AmaxDRAFT_3782 [Limnospira maxima CS-328]|uniref:Uncharacterized protein n=1 Tax=Limnospira maxima CS-328 TaxID=513049 RepID=B5W4T4_LIMMA|nr:hypothetical protein AmaxDRAFT_3782 [Limnospira maxima CS-328]